MVLVQDDWHKNQGFYAILSDLTFDIGSVFFELIFTDLRYINAGRILLV